MRRVIATLAVLAAVAAVPGAADFRNHVEIGPFSFLTGSAMLGYERAVTKNISACLGAGYRSLTTTEVFDFGGHEASESYYVVDPGLKVFSRPGSRGFVGHLDLAVRYYKYSYYEDPHRLETYHSGEKLCFAPAILGGYRWVFVQHITLTPAAGLEFLLNPPPSTDIFFPLRGDINVGFLF